MNRDAFVLLLRTLILGWQAKQIITGSITEESMELQVLRNKTQMFLKNEFGIEE